MIERNPYHHVFVSFEGPIFDRIGDALAKPDSVVFLSAVERERWSKHDHGHFKVLGPLVVPIATSSHMFSFLEAAGIGSYGNP